MGRLAHSNANQEIIMATYPSLYTNTQDIFVGRDIICGGRRVYAKGIPLGAKRTILIKRRAAWIKNRPHRKFFVSTIGHPYG